ncbi:F0F1 ATP synthase subunit delta, partial [Chloroflexota bacterium]
MVRGKFSLANDIATEYQHLVDSHRGIEQAEVTTAVPLDDEDITRLSGRLGILVDKKIALTSKV